MSALLAAVLAILLVIGLPVLLLYFLLRGGGKITAERRRILAEGTPASAVIVGLSSALRHRGPNKIPLIEVSMRVHLDGAEPYRISAPWWIDQEAMAKVQPGTEIRVLVGKDRSRVYPHPGDTQFEYAWVDEAPR